MAEACLLIDSDIFVWLAGAGLLDRALAILGFRRENSRRLSPLPHMLARGRKFAHLTPRTNELASEACKSVPEITERPRDDLLQQLVSVPEIDEGEALLYATLAEQPDWLLTSADRRAMLAVGSRPQLRDVRQRVAGRVVCLETVLELLVRQDGVQSVAEALAVFPNVKSFQVFFSSVNVADQASCLRSLDSYLRDLKRQVGDDFLYQP